MSLPVLCEEVTCLDVCDVVGSFSLYLLWCECLSVVVLVCELCVVLCGKGCSGFLWNVVVASAFPGTRTGVGDLT